MKAVRTILSISWLALAVIVLASSVSDMSLRSWQPTWLVIGIAATLLAVASATFLFFQTRQLRVVAMAGAAGFLLYWSYLFLISPPDAMNRYLLSGLVVMVLSIATIALIVVGNKTP